MQIVAVHNNAAIATTAALAETIWRQHFTPIIGLSQVEYMLEKFQSVTAIQQQLQSGWQYFLAVLDAQAIGYAGLVADRAAGRLMLSKLYVKQSARGRGVGRQLLQFIEQKCRSEGFKTLWLTVNRHNSGPIAFYQQAGFVTVDEVVKDIGAGYVMDDFVMEKTIMGCI